METSSITTNSQSPVFSPVEYINEGIQATGTITTTESISTATTVLPIPPVEVYMIPNVDLLEASAIYKLKISEINYLYSKELFDNIITDADLVGIVNSFTIEQLNDINFYTQVLK
jgi:hypothetical protein